MKNELNYNREIEGKREGEEERLEEREIEIEKDVRREFIYFHFIQIAEFH